MHLKPQDLLLCLGLCVRNSDAWTYADLAASLGLSASEAKKGVDRACDAGLLIASLDPGGKPVPMRRALLDFLVFGVRHAFYAQPGQLVRGVPTAWAAPALSGLVSASEEPPPVWPSRNGSVRGQAIEPLYPSVPKVALENPALYELLALVDALRIGRVRERELAAEALRAKLLQGSPPSYAD